MKMFTVIAILSSEISGEILSEMLLSFTGMTELNDGSESNSATLLHAANTVYHQQNDKI